MAVRDSQASDLTLRPARPEDAADLGRICYEAFRSIASRYNLAPGFPSPEVATARLVGPLSHSGFYKVVAERDGKVVGSNFVDERSPIAGLGPITIDPEVQDRGIGRRLMQDALERAASRGVAGVRLVQAAYHTRSIALYAKLGFVVREPLALMQGARFRPRSPVARCGRHAPPTSRTAPASVTLSTATTGRASWPTPSAPERRPSSSTPAVSPATRPQWPSSGMP